MISEKILTQDQLAAIGSIAVESSIMEHEIDRIIVAMTRLTEKKLIPFMNGKMMQGKLEVVEQLIPMCIKKKSAQTELKNLIGMARTANTRRTSFIHGHWLLNVLALYLEKPLKGDAVAVNKKKPLVKPVHAKEAAAVAQEIADVTDALRQFHLEQWVQPILARQRKLLSKPLKPLLRPEESPLGG